MLVRSIVNWRGLLWKEKHIDIWRAADILKRKEWFYPKGKGTKFACIRRDTLQGWWLECKHLSLRRYGQGNHLYSFHCISSLKSVNIYPCEDLCTEESQWLLYLGAAKSKRHVAKSKRQKAQDACFSVLIRSKELFPRETKRHEKSSKLSHPKLSATNLLWKSCPGPGTLHPQRRSGRPPTYPFSSPQHVPQSHNLTNRTSPLLTNIKAGLLTQSIFTV